MEHAQVPVRRVLFNALPLRRGGAGVSTYIRELLTALSESTTLQLSAAVAAGAEGELPRDVQPVVRPPTSGSRRALQGLRLSGDADVIHGLDMDVPLRRDVARVTTVHDLAVFDTPWAFPRGRVTGERLLATHAISQSDAVVAVSSFTAERVWERFGKQAVVVPEAPGRCFTVPSPEVVAAVRLRYELPERFVLHVGTVEPRKDVPVLARACSRLDVPLVLAGARGVPSTLAGDVRALGFVPEHDLPGLYGAATLATYVSIYEGFGLPPIEAMACGCPVISSNVPSVALVGGARVVSAGNEDQLFAALREVSADNEQRSEMIAAGLKAARRLTWRDAARATTAVYDALGTPSGARRGGSSAPAFLSALHRSRLAPGSVARPRS